MKIEICLKKDRCPTAGNYFFEIMIFTFQAENNDYGGLS